MTRSRRFSVVDNHSITKTVFAKLAPVVDVLRDLKTKPFGARPYQVKLVWTRWSGAERGEGVEELVTETLVLPTPNVDLSSLSNTLQPIGTEETGTVTVREISPRYTEDQLMGRLADGTPVDETTQFYWEVYFPRPNEPGVRRRFTPAGAPSYNPTAFEWTIRLVRAGEDRSRTGEPR